jgi:hypothetical protein
MAHAEGYVSHDSAVAAERTDRNKEGNMSTLLARNAEVLVTMDDDRREIPGGGLFARDGLIEQVGTTDGSQGPVTAVIMTTVTPGQEQEFERRHPRVKERQSTYPGFLGCEVQPPTGTFQQEWVTLLRFDSNEHLDNWLESDERRQLLREADEIIDRSSERRVRTSFEGWFKFGADHRPPPSWKQSAIVLLVLFPVVMLEITFLNPILAWMNVSPATFIANVISVGALTWPLIPLASRAMGWWLSPSPDAGSAVRWGGPALLVALYAVSIVFFHFFTGWVHISPITSL